MGYEKKYNSKTYEERQEELKNTLKILEQGIKNVFTSDKYMEYLKTMSKFHNYSINNVLWVQMQNPNASVIAGLKTWNELGRKVNKGEKALRVLAPMKHTKLIEIEKVDANTKKPIKEKQKVEWISYKAVPVFDISQTNGKELPSLISELQGNIKHFDHMKNALTKVAKIPIEFEDIKDSKGYYHLTENRIAIKKGMSDMQTIKTMIHEIAHSRLHNIKEEKSISSIMNRNAKETEAESVAFVVSNHFDIDTSDYSFGYIASWSKDYELTDLKASLSRIQKESSSLITEIEAEVEKVLEIENENIQDEKQVDMDMDLEKNIIKKESFTEKGINRNGYFKEPFLEIRFSESNEFKSNEVISFKDANKKFKDLEKQVRGLKEKYKENGEYYPYLKTSFNLYLSPNIVKEMRYDIGDGYSNNLKEFCELQLGKEFINNVFSKERKSVKDKLEDIKSKDTNKNIKKNIKNKER